MFSSLSFAGDIYDKFPEHFNANEKYVFYSHGFILEGTNPTPKNERWGVYEFPAIKESLSDNEYNLIAYHRPKGTDPFKHAQVLANNVRELIKNGVDADHITIMGFSRGAFITSLTSHYLEETPVNTVLLAGCGRIVSNKYSDIKMNGDFLSVYETTDGVEFGVLVPVKSFKIEVLTFNHLKRFLFLQVKSMVLFIDQYLSGLFLLSNG